VGDFIFHWLTLLAVFLILFSGKHIHEIMQGFREEIIRHKRQFARRPRPLRFSRGETSWQALIRHLHRLLAKILLSARIRRNR
jgi:Ni,Fe-hydrogenase I cytochrome b subunit